VLYSIVNDSTHPILARICPSSSKLLRTDKQTDRHAKKYAMTSVCKTAVIFYSWTCTIAMQNTSSNAIHFTKLSKYVACRATNCL